MRATQKTGQPERSFITPINESPMLPPLPAVTKTETPLSAPPPKPVRNPALPALPASGAAPADQAASQAAQ